MAAGKPHAESASRWCSSLRVLRRAHPHREARTTTVYRVTDRLHAGRSVHAPGYEVVETVRAWLAELGADSPLVEDLARAIRTGDWPAVYAIGEYLSIDVSAAS
jgi:hypothetical protein